ncbi:helix-turn-helix transcriptional regulator [Aureibacillus halotolerans]|uniref:Helix-turn-helix protein n=1 Tax=Aureibacillus halotolerans TaxID=1508390 RepID=A0A4R6U757_9BACI|nr:AraC family transcriptional regulator [Aureibacillus halotolerans]TDQ40723.1 helix-turn-helix protein [Aureibacillus halotolerans]
MDESKLIFSAPPFPSYLSNGQDTYRPGQRHMSRDSLGVFDLLVVTEGALYIGESDRKWTIRSNEALILRPDQHHFGTEPCQERTHFHWLHFYTNEPWHMEHRRSEEPAVQTQLPGMFLIQLPQHIRLPAPDQTLAGFRDLIEMEKQSGLAARWTQQTHFQQILQSLIQDQMAPDDPVVKLADAATALLRREYQKPFSYEGLGEQLHFHPTYIARCVKRVYRCTLLDYLNGYRISKAKMLLISTSFPIAEVGEKAGFQNRVYFTRRFKEAEGVSPKQYRERFRRRGVKGTD